MMQYLAMDTNDIRTNLATEQYLMNSDKMTPPFMLFYIQNPCIIVGRNQNTLEEINKQYCEEHGIAVTRRLSGGGAMYQDRGNMCFSFIVPANDSQFGDFKKLVQPVVDVLHRMGVTGATVTGRNDIVVDGKKFSGNAMYTRDGRTFCHGTLMYDVDTSAVAAALHVPEDKIKSKGIKSVRSRVTNIKPYLKPEYQNLTMEQFRDELIKQIWNVDTLAEAQKNEYHLTDEDRREIQKIGDELYYNWDWVYGKSPEFTDKKRRHFTGGTIDARFFVKAGQIKDVKIYGDFFGTAEVTDLEDALRNQPYTMEAMRTVLSKFDLTKYFVGIDPQEVVQLLVG